MADSQKTVQKVTCELKDRPQKVFKIHRRIQNPVEHLRWSFLRKYLAMNYFRKKPHLRCLTGF